MKSTIAMITLSAFAALAVPAAAQDHAAQDQVAAAAKPAMSASMPMDCPMMSKSVQGSTGASHDMSCAKPGKENADKPAKGKPAHDHGKFHKNQ
jgi:hypothetical protein